MALRRDFAQNIALSSAGTSVALCAGHGPVTPIVFDAHARRLSHPPPQPIASGSAADLHRGSWRSAAARVSRQCSRACAHRPPKQEHPRPTPSRPSSPSPTMAEARAGCARVRRPAARRCSELPRRARRARIHHSSNCCSIASAPRDEFAGHPLGNLLLTALTQITGDFGEAVSQLGAMMGLRGRVLPTTVENVRLRAEMESGSIVTGETAIVEQTAADPPPDARAEPEADAGGASRPRQRGRHRRWPRKPLHQHPAEPAGRRNGVDDLWRQCGTDLRRQPDDRAWRNRRLHPRRPPARRFGCTQDSICSTTSSSIGVRSTGWPPNATHSRDPLRSCAVSHCSGQGERRSSNAISPLTTIR